MIKIDLTVIKNQFRELLEALNNSEVDKLEIDILLGVFAVSLRTHKEKLIREANKNKELQIKNQKEINFLKDIEEAFTAKILSPLEDIKWSVEKCHDIFLQHHIEP
jgi:hypothetical protein